MTANIDMSNDRANIAFLGSRRDIWHRLGQEMAPGMTIEQWALAAGLDWQAVKVPAIANLQGPYFDNFDPGKRFVDTGLYFNARSDTGAVISGSLSDRHVNVQPIDVLNWFQRYISVDDRFQLDVAGSLRGGAVIWATAIFREALEVAGDKHLARVLMTTTFDASGATINQATMTRVVCNNTLDAALTDKRAVVRTRHNTTFDPARVGTELGRIAQGFAVYKQVGDALAVNEMSSAETSAFFKSCLDIPFDAKEEDCSTRKLNQFRALRDSYGATIAEGTPKNTAWAALNAITRYVDHDKATRGNGVSAEEKQFTSAQFGSGAAMKATAMQLLMPRIADKVLIPA